MVNKAVNKLTGKYVKNIFLFEKMKSKSFQNNKMT